MNSAHEPDFSDGCSYVDLYAIVDGRVKPKRDAEKEEKRIRRDITRRPTNNRSGPRYVQNVRQPSPVENPKTSTNRERRRNSTPKVKHPACNKMPGHASTPTTSPKENRACDTSIPLEVFVSKHKRLQTGSLHSEKKHHNKLHDGQERREERTHLSTSRRRSLDYGQPSREQGNSHSSSRRHSECQSRRSVDSRGSSGKMGNNSSHSGSRRYSACQSHRPAAEPKGSSDKMGHHSSQSPSTHCVSDKSRRTRSHRSGDIRRPRMVADQRPTNNDELQESPSRGTRQSRTAPLDHVLRAHSCQSTKTRRASTIHKQQHASRSLDDVKEIRDQKPAYLSQLFSNPMQNLERFNKGLGRNPPRRLLRDHSCRSINERGNALSRHQSSRSLDDVEEILTPKPSKIAGRLESNDQNPTACNGFSLRRYF